MVKVESSQQDLEIIKSERFGDGGLDEIRKVNFYRPQSDLEQFSGSIEQYFYQHPVRSIAEANAKIEELTGPDRGAIRNAAKYDGKWVAGKAGSGIQMLRGDA